MVFSPDGTRLASASAYGLFVKIWDVTTGLEVHSLEGHADGIYSVAFSPDGSRLAAASSDQTVKLWDVIRGQVILTLQGHTGAVSRVAFSPDGTRLVSVGKDRVNIWEARSWNAAAAEQLSVEREALGLLDYLFARPLNKADVRDHVRQTPLLRPRAREMALKWLEQYREDTDAERYDQASWAIVRHRFANSIHKQWALRQAQTACRLAPDNGHFLTTLGVAHYRAGQRCGSAGGVDTSGFGRAQSSPLS